MVKGRVLKIYDTKAVFENLDTGNCLVATLAKDGTNLAKEFQNVDRSQLPDFSERSQSITFESIFGFYDLLSGTYVALVIETEPYVNINNKNIVIRKVKKIILVPLFRNGKPLSESRQKDEDGYIKLLYSAFTEHNFFYSSTFDLTLTQQRIALMAGKSSDSLWSRADNRFFWNRDVIADIIACKADDWIVPFMSAYIEFRPECQADNDKFTLLFISRRCRFRQGCRFTKRGIDEFGNPANYVETEQILVFPDGRVSSFVQIRGSIPLKWCSPVTMKYDPVVHIDENKQQSIEWAEKHVHDVLELYGNVQNKSGIVFVNLIDTKKDQNRLGLAFKDVVDGVKLKNPNQTLEYVWFDFHKECKAKGKWKNLGKLVSKVDNQLRAQQYFSKGPAGEVNTWQTGVFRTNCMDNLDRTNVVQSLFARRSLLMQLGRSDLLSDDKYVLDTPWKAFEKVYKTVWANNANAMSFGYAGTGALKVDFTKTGKRTIKGMIDDGVNSVMRYYINNFTDGVKQDGIDLMLGTYRPDPQAPSPFVPRPGQETFAMNLTRAFVLMMTLFSLSLLFSPIIDPLTSLIYSSELIAVLAQKPGLSVLKVLVDASCSPQSDRLTVKLLMSVGITLLVSFYLLFVIVKKGAKIGEKMVIHPQLLPEPPPETTSSNSSKSK